MHRREVIAATVGLLSAAALTGGAAAAEPEALREVRLGTLRLLVASPKKKSGGGVLIQPTAGGVNAHTNRVAQELAAIGYTAVVWDPYDGDPVPDEERAMVALSRRLQDEKVMADLRRATDHMLGPLGVERVASIGWCMGGRYTLMHAGTDNRVVAVAAYNPTIYSPAGQPLNGSIASKSAMPGQTMDEAPVIPRIPCPVNVYRP